MKIPFVGPTYPLESKPASVQQTVGMYPVPIETQNERVTWVFKDIPGLVENTEAWPDVPAAADWLGYNFDDLGPTQRSFGIFAPLGTAVPWSDGTSFTNSQSTNDDVVYVPLLGGTTPPPDVVENTNWFPVVPLSDPPVFLPSEFDGDGQWSGHSWVLQGTTSGYIVLQGLTGPTTITFTIVPTGGTNYDGASLLYGEEL